MNEVAWATEFITRDIRTSIPLKSRIAFRVPIPNNDDAKKGGDKQRVT